jgi:hypothetical protein
MLIMHGCLLPVRNQIEALRCVATPNTRMLLSSLDVPVLGFSLRALIDRQSFSFSQFWQAIPEGIPRAVDEQLRGWLEYIFIQFRQLELSLGYEDPSPAITVQGSGQPHTLYRQQPIDVSEQLPNRASNQKRHVDNPIDQSGDVIIVMLQKAAKLSSDNCARTRIIANDLCRQLRATEDRINELEAEIEHFRDRAIRAETWLQRLQREIEQKLIATATTPSAAPQLRPTPAPTRRSFWPPRLLRFSSRATSRGGTSAATSADIPQWKAEATALRRRNDAADEGAT